MAAKTKRISTLIESQLPEFISSEYELFGRFVEKYYESLEVQGGTLDVINNLQKYTDIDFYEKNLLKQSDSLAVEIDENSSVIVLQDASSFPKKNGYVRIEDEIIFYGVRTNTELRECSRGISGNTTLGDLYNSSDFDSTTAANHAAGKQVYNVSNLFLYAFVKNFENQYLGSFPEKYLKGDVDKRTLIKNIQKFYKTKGTSSSISFIFNTIVNKEPDSPAVYNPKDFTYKSSESDWVKTFAVKAKLVSGDPKTLIGKKLIQTATAEYGYADAIVDNVSSLGTFDGEQIYNVVLAPETVNGEFSVSTKTKLQRRLDQSQVSGRIDVFSTIGWDQEGSILIGEEVIEFEDKNATQFIIKSRGLTPLTYEVGEIVYKPVSLIGGDVNLISMGIVYDLKIKSSAPYASSGDKIQVSPPGFQTADPKIVVTGTNTPRWIFSSSSVSAPTNTNVESALSEVKTNVSAIFADDQYYYIASSSYPNYTILDGVTATQRVEDQNLLRLIRKQSTRTTEVYKTPKKDVGILVNGTPIYSYKDSESIRYGSLEKIEVESRGSGYVNPPFVLVDGLPNKARAVMSGQIVDGYIVDTQNVFPKTPEITVTSGRNASIRAIVTNGKVTSLVIDNPGEFYSSPPIVSIRDRKGKGRFANFEAIVDIDGDITGFNKIEEGSFYTQENIEVVIISVGSGAVGDPLLKEWNKNRYENLKSELDTENGYLFANTNIKYGYGYGHVANPKTLRVGLNDNIDSTGSEPSTKIHSPIIGFAYDGNPIYGPFGYTSPLNSQSSISRMTSSYSLKGNRTGGPQIVDYQLGFFVNDYEYIHKSGSLDENNGRFCVTPDFPEGTYAYFLTIDSNQEPQFPYFVGENFYSLPVDSNYNSDISQSEIPKNAKRLNSSGITNNGEGLIAFISEVKSGTIDSLQVDNSSANFSPNSKVYFDNTDTEGRDVEAIVSSVNGKSVNYLQSKEDKVVRLTTIQNAYLFSDDTLTQPSSNASGTIVGLVQNENVIVLKDVIGRFDNTGTFSATIKTFSLLIDQNGTYTAGATLFLTDGKNPPVAEAIILESTNRQNILTIKAETGDWSLFNDPDNDYFIQSDNLFNTSGSRIITLSSLSDNLEPFDVNQSVALIETATDHGLGVGDDVVIDINPDDTTKSKTYYVRKRLYQEVTFLTPKNDTKINFSGIGRFDILNGGIGYAVGTYEDISLTGGSGTGAKATLVVSEKVIGGNPTGVVSSVTITDFGSGYKKFDYLGVDDSDLLRANTPTLGNARFTILVDHAGFAAGENSLYVNSTVGFANNDLLQIGNEVVKITSIDSTNNIFTVDRAQDGTSELDHYNNQVVSLYKGGYNFTDNFRITTDAGSGFIRSYNRETQTAVIVFDYSIIKSSARNLLVGTNFFDASSPTARFVSVGSADEIDFKFEFSEDNTTFIKNPNIDIQEFYRYVFDTSHSSMSGVSLDFSPSKNYNVVTVEKLQSGISPGSSGSFTDLKFGFGSRLATNGYSTKVGTDFTNFYYFDKNNIVSSDDRYLKIITDPLQGKKKLTYVTPNRFVYDIPFDPLYDGSGSISYKTTGEFAVGSIDSFAITNSGLNYKKVPIIDGVDPNSNFKARATVLFDTVTNTINAVDITDKGSDYNNPKVVITNGDGLGAEFNIIAQDGKILSITVKNPGKGYTYQPEIEIVETSVEIYAVSNSIGVPQSIKISQNGGAYHLDKTVASTFTGKYIVSLKNPQGKFLEGEIVKQTINGVEVSRAEVSEWRPGSNLLKLEKIEGTLRQNFEIKGSVSKSTGTVVSIFVTELNPSIASFYDNIGYYISDRGKLGVSNQRITDSYFYQDYSYVIKSKTPIEQWRDLIKSTTHPAGFNLFGEVAIDAKASTKMPTKSSNAGHFTLIQLWDPEKNIVTVENTRRTITQTVQKVDQYNIIKGLGSASTSEFNFNETRAFEVKLSANFDGYYDSDGRLQGTKTFQVKDDEGNLFTPYSPSNLIITLDGILQEPNVAYTVSGQTITFTNPPLGNNTKQTGNTISDVTEYKGVTFYGKYIQFKDNQYDDRYIKKTQNIFQRNGRWIDAANQIERNKLFIVAESVGYGKNKYPSLDWSTKTDDYERDLGFIVDAYSHDLRFGGNVKINNYVNIINDENKYDYFTKNKTESLGIVRYLTNLVNLSVRNWDFVEENVSYLQGSFKVDVSNTNNLAVGMYISSGTAFAPDTKIVSINSSTEITLNKAALANSGGAGGASVGITNLQGTAPAGGTTLPTAIGRVVSGGQYEVAPGSIVAVPVSFSSSDSATFFFSGINNGTFYDASNLIEKNKQYIMEEVSGWFAATYPSTVWTDLNKDINEYIDGVVYHSRFGGNEYVVDLAQNYYRNTFYPYPETLKYNVDATKYSAGYSFVRDLMVLAMRNNLTVGTYTNISPYFDNTIATDSTFPACIQVESALDSFYSIMNTILTEGKGLVERTSTNSSKPGNWTGLLPYSNYTIIPDSLLPSYECADVVSSVDSLYTTITNILNNSIVPITYPDYVDGENKIFELYWEDGTDVITEEDEDLFLTINAVLQKPKYKEDYPAEDAYYIDRTVVPNRIVFDVAPIWDQDLGAKSIGEPTAVEKVVGIGVGNYKRLTVDKSLISGSRGGPFLILDLEDLTVQNIEDSAYLYVFLDGVLQREGYSYSVIGPNITFKSPIKKEMKIDIRYLYGREIGQILNIYDFTQDTYYVKSSVELQTTSGAATLVEGLWAGKYNGNTLHAWQINSNGTRNIIGEVLEIVATGNVLNLNVYGMKCELLQGEPVVFSIKGQYSVNYTVPLASTGSTLTYDVDDKGRLLLSDNLNDWKGSIIRKSYKNPFVSLSDNDFIRVEGESRFRKIKKLPQIVGTREERLQKGSTNSVFGTVEVETYSGVTRGEGLSVVAVVENGSVVRLDWNQRSYDPLTQPTAYQYYTPPVLNFVPQNGNGGGAKAVVLVSKGQVVSVELIDGGTGYTEAPLVRVSRRYDLKKERGIGVSLINLKMNPYVDTAGMTAISTIDILGSQVSGVNSFTSVFFDSPVDTDRQINAQIQLVEETGEDLDAGLVEHLSTVTSERDTALIDTEHEITEINVYIETPYIVNIDALSTLTLQSSNREITNSVSNVINNTALSNVNYYEIAAYLQVDADPTDSIIYIADTSKFKSTGYLLVGKEVVRYFLKFGDRFLKVKRGVNNTTAQFWSAGTYIRQIPDPVSIAYGGVSTIESQSSLVSVKGGAEVGLTERETERLIITPDVSPKTSTRVITTAVQPQLNVQSISQISSKVVYRLEPPAGSILSFNTTRKETSVRSVVQTVHSEFVIKKESTEFLIFTPPGGVVDGYEESAFIDDPIKTRLNGMVDLLDDYGVVQRNGNTIFVKNSIFSTFNQYVGNYKKTNVGYVLKHFDGLFDDGTANVSGYTLADVEFYFPSLSIRDFIERGESQYTLGGEKFNILPPSIQNPVAISSSVGTIGGAIIVQDTTSFPSSGFLFTSSGSVIEYTSKTTNSFEGCTLTRGPNSIVSGDELIPFSN
jgi:hypothetical protein